MRKDTILKTAIAYYDNEDECWVAYSPLWDNIIGAADTEAEAWQLFFELLNEAWSEHEKGHYAKEAGPGRPRRGKQPLNVQVKSETRDRIKALAETLDLSQGDVIDYLAALPAAKLAS